MVGGAMIDMGINIGHQSDFLFLQLQEYQNVRNAELVVRDSSKQITDIRSSIQILDTLKLYFHFITRGHLLNHNIHPGPASQIIVHRDLDEMGRNYQTFYKTIDAPDDVFTKNVGTPNPLSFLLLLYNDFLSGVQLRNIQENQGPLSMERHRRVIKTMS